MTTTDMIEETIGSRIKSRRRGLGHSQAQLAASVGVSANAIRKWEHDAHTPKGRYLDGLAEALETTVAYLWGDVPDPGIDVAHSVTVVGSYDPDEPPVPAGLFKAVRILGNVTLAELDECREIYDPLRKRAGARGAYGWSVGAWIDVIEERRAERGKGKKGKAKRGE